MTISPSPHPAAGTGDHRQFLRNEFAMVELTLLGERHAQRLRIRNAETDDVVELDPLELEALTRLSHHDLGRLIVGDMGDVGDMNDMDDMGDMGESPAG